MKILAIALTLAAMACLSQGYPSAKEVKNLVRMQELINKLERKEAVLQDMGDEDGFLQDMGDEDGVLQDTGDEDGFLQDTGDEDENGFMQDMVVEPGFLQEMGDEDENGVLQDEPGSLPSTAEPGFLQEMEDNNGDVEAQFWGLIARGAGKLLCKHITKRRGPRAMEQDIDMWLKREEAKEMSATKAKIMQDTSDDVPSAQFFRRLFRRVRRGFKKIGRGVKRFWKKHGAKILRVGRGVCKAVKYVGKK